MSALQEAVSPVVAIGFAFVIGIFFGGMIVGEAKGKRLLRGDRELFEPKDADHERMSCELRGGKAAK